jgi:citrate lyase gamma subunit
VYRWLTSDDFLIGSLVPNATVVEANPTQDTEDVIRALPNDAAFFHFHLNCTITRQFPLARETLLDTLVERGIRTVNASVTDISKSRIHTVLKELGLPSAAATRKGSADEKLFVKTNLNFGGDSEWALSEDQRGALGIPGGSSLIYNPNHYQVLPRGEIPVLWWADPSLVIERYITNSQDRWYRAFVNYSRLVICELTSEAVVKKVGGSQHLQSWSLETSSEESQEAAPPSHLMPMVRSLRAFIGRMGLDFGAVDVLLDDDARPFIIDVNTTPAYNHPIPGLVESLRKAVA